jgi:hypothetical protein
MIECSSALTKATGHLQVEQISQQMLDKDKISSCGKRSSLPCNYDRKDFMKSVRGKSAKIVFSSLFKQAIKN